MILINWIKYLFIKFPKKSPPELKEVIYFLIKKYGFNKNNFKFNSKFSFNIITENNRIELLYKIINFPNFKYEGKGHSSLGRINFKNKIKFYIKPKSKQGELAPGKSNENIFEKNINKYLEQYNNINITFISTTKKYEIKNITNILNTSTKDTNKYNKSDFSLYNNKKKIANLSLKQSGDFIWESSISRYKYIYEKFIFNFINNNIKNLQAIENVGLPGRYFMINPSNNKSYSRIYIKGFPEYDDDNIIFGNEVPKPIVIEKTFIDRDFTNDLNNIYILVNNIYEDIKQIEDIGKLPVLSFSRNMSKPYGIDFKCVPENKTKYTSKANILEIPYEVLMKL